MVNKLGFKLLVLVSLSFDKLSLGKYGDKTY